jgi:hypothetical protein
MWEPRHLTTLWAFTACYRDSFTFLPFFLPAWVFCMMAVFTELPSLPYDLKTISARGLVKYWCAYCGVSWPVVFHIVICKLSHQNYQALKLFHFWSGSVGPLHCFRWYFPCVSNGYKLDWSVKSCTSLSPITTLITSLTLLGLSVKVISPLVLKNCSLSHQFYTTHIIVHLNEYCFGMKYLQKQNKVTTIYLNWWGWPHQCPGFLFQHFHHGMWINKPVCVKSVKISSLAITLLCEPMLDTVKIIKQQWEQSWMNALFRYVVCSKSFGTFEIAC